MYSQEFMRFLINYQTPECKEKSTTQVKYFRFTLKDRILASIPLMCKK